MKEPEFGIYYKTAELMQLERELVLLLNDGDESAFEKLYDFYKIRILKKLISILKDEEIASEVLQDIFLTIWERRQTIDPDKSFRSYLFRIAENKIVDVFRRAARNKRLEEHIVSASTGSSNHTEEVITFKESNALIIQAINNLPPQRKKIFILCRIEGKTYEEAGKILQISTGTVNDHMVKAIRAIRQYYSKAVDLVILLFIAFLN